jgi:hypothetical protein
MIRVDGTISQDSITRGILDVLYSGPSPRRPVEGSGSASTSDGDLWNEAARLSR